MAVTYSEVRWIAMTLPEVVEGTSYGTTAYRVSGKLFARAHSDGQSLVVRCDPNVREILMEGAPEIYFITDHYIKSNLVQVRLAAVEPEQIINALTEAWRMCATKRLRKDFDAINEGP